MTGGGSKLQGFLELLRQRIPVPVEPGRVFSRVVPALEMPEDARPRRSPSSPSPSGWPSRGVDR